MNIAQLRLSEYSLHFSSHIHFQLISLFSIHASILAFLRLLSVFFHSSHFSFFHYIFFFIITSFLLSSLFVSLSYFHHLTDIFLRHSRLMIHLFYSFATVAAFLFR